MISTESSQRGAEARIRQHPTLGLAVLFLLWFITWALSHSYRGIFHDARLYTLQALARLSPDSLPQDVFLRFGSQDRYTIFSPLFAATARLLGVEHAAAALTFGLQLALFFCAWRLARFVMPAGLALLGIAVLIAIPGDYGPEGIFTCVEPYLTPRMGAEALVLGSLVAALGERRALALALATVAALIHPIMAAAGIAALLCLNVAIPRPRLTIALVATAMLVLVTAAFAMPIGMWGRFDSTWLALVKDRSPYLFLSYWQLDDWGRVTVTLATLTVGLGALPSTRGRALCLAALLTTAGGLLLTFLACDELHLVLITQLQPWRWQWLGTVTAALLLPQILHTRWREGVSGRTTALLLVATWVFSSSVPALVAALTTVTSIAFARRLTPNEARLVLWGACGMLAIAVIWRMASNFEFTNAHNLDPRIPLWMRRAMSFAQDGAAPIFVIVLAGWLARSQTRRTGLIVLAAVAAAACTALLPQTWTRWTAQEFPAKVVAQFTPLREHIPVGADVFWANSPVATWLLLDRPSYLSAVQAAGVVFSRDTALELKRRATALSSVVPPQSFLGWNEASPSMNLAVPQLMGICQTAAFEYLVTSVDLGVPSIAILPQNSGPASSALRLYRCPMHLG